MSRDKRLVLLVHGWSVRDTSTYGGLPERLKREAKRRPELGLEVKEIWLSEYISFHNEVGIPDIARAFQAALERELGEDLAKGRRFACITHSTGGPVIRSWLQRYYLDKDKRRCPMSHLVMLAPANFGSALVQLGLAKLSRLRSAWFEGVDVGTGVLDWLELGSAQSLTLNLEWLDKGAGLIGPDGMFPFVLAGQSHDPLLYDFVNSYSGETGSDGAVRVASANLNFTHLRLTQQAPLPDKQSKLGFSAPRLSADTPRLPPAVPFAVIPGVCHSDVRMGIVRSVPEGDAPHPTVDALLKALAVADMAGYARAFDEFAALTAATQERQRVEDRKPVTGFDHQLIHDPCSMLVFRVRDDEGNPVKDFDVVLTAGPQDNPNHLPPGFFVDRQRNHLDPGCIVYYVNAARLLGAAPVMHGDRQIRPALPSAGSLGLRVIPFPQSGFVLYQPAMLKTDARHLKDFIKPNQTTLVDIVLKRIVREGVYRLTRKPSPEDFTKQPPGMPID
ncbi:MAG TPA: phospholipase [Gammaproteobacteria bacterium]|jgi:hypothetical protein|nr:phospholipase [Gammaproteobacteria bacterium]